MVASRPLHVSSRALARKDAQDKDSLKPEPNEYSKSASDDQAAKSMEDTAFSPDKTSPEEQLDDAGGEANSKGVSGCLLGESQHGGLT